MKYLLCYEVLHWAFEWNSLTITDNDNYSLEEVDFFVQNGFIDIKFELKKQLWNY